MIRLVIADDHPLILNGLTGLFNFEEDFEVLASCSNGPDALEEIRRQRPDVAVLDIRMPGLSGIEVARRVTEERLGARLVLLTAALEDADMLEAVMLGIQGVVLKEMAPQFLVQCIRKVHAGEQWLERRSAKQALEKLLKREAGGREVSGLLTQREIELVRMVAGGLRNREIADRLCISEGTVKVHLHNIYQKIHVDGRVALLRYAQDKGLV
ncbi:response regulator transcription factor [Geomonas sp. Red69]|uniref:Response regulator transcription factor n=1 Tax=Geomonas diazotrophica TaxID=2843197 RepID=A0ABX8JHG6_9BACT|nr:MULTISPECIES: response regulator transcription factor [Geomonas]MBU5635132.1 response regulator transcription factor [Geomonas diazotrophica]QWV97820.1 response regulator transcription factor [Geomonas nitrogeniifigens]QXE86960.1 response regulator transcription factor [Geomonas nitrogeniifigens]